MLLQYEGTIRLNLRRQDGKPQEVELPCVFAPHILMNLLSPRTITDIGGNYHMAPGECYLKVDASEGDGAKIFLKKIGNVECMLELEVIQDKQAQALYAINKLEHFRTHLMIFDLPPLHEDFISERAQLDGKHHKCDSCLTGKIKKKKRRCQNHIHRGAQAMETENIAQTNTNV